MEQIIQQSQTQILVPIDTFEDKLYSVDLVSGISECVRGCLKGHCKHKKAVVQKFKMNNFEWNVPECARVKCFILARMEWHIPFRPEWNAIPWLGLRNMLPGFGFSPPFPFFTTAFLPLIVTMVSRTKALILETTSHHQPKIHHHSS